MATHYQLVIQVATGGTQPLGGGLKVITGGALINQYNTLGVGMNLANYFKADTFPLVILGTANGLIFSHTGGNANVGNVRAFYQTMQIGTQSNASFNCVLGEVPDATSLAPAAGTINIPFIAIGQPY